MSYTCACNLPDVALLSYSSKQARLRLSGNQGRSSNHARALVAISDMKIGLYEEMNASLHGSVHGYTVKHRSNGILLETLSEVPTIGPTDGPF